MSLILLAILRCTVKEEDKIEATDSAMREVNHTLENAKSISDHKIEEGLDRTSLKNSRMIFNKPAILNHTKPLYLRTHVNRKPLDMVLADNGSTVNVIPLKTSLSLKKIEDDITSTN